MSPLRPGRPTLGRPDATGSTSRPRPTVLAQRFFEPPSAPKELIPRPVGATVHSFRYSSFVRERDIRAIAIDWDSACGDPPVGLSKKPHLTSIFTDNPCPVVHLGYISSHRQRWTSQGTALGETVYSLSLAPGESRNIAVIDLRRRQQSRRHEDTEADERLISNQDHNFALQEVATAVALEQQHGKTSVEASTLVTGGAFVAAGAVVGGVAGGLVGTLVEPGIGTAVGAAVGAGAGVAAGGLVFAGAQALGMIEAESSGDREIVGETNQRIAQSTSQQSALIRSLWSTVVTEDVQAESFEVETTNVTNYNHMHALNMEYYEVLHRYDTEVEFTGATPILYLPFGALPLGEEALVDEFWDSIRPGLPEALQAKGDAVFVDPPPAAFVPQTVPDEPDPPPDVTIKNLYIEVEVDWDLEWSDVLLAAGAFVLGGALLGSFMAFMAVGADETLRNAEATILLRDGTFVGHTPTLESRTDDAELRQTTFKLGFAQALDARDIAGVEVHLSSSWDIFDPGVDIRVAAASATVEGSDDLSIAGQRLFSGELEQEGGRGRKEFSWTLLDEDTKAYDDALAEIERIEQENAAGQQAYDDLIAVLDQYRLDVLGAVAREPFRFTMLILSGMEQGRLTWILDRLILTGDDVGEGGIPLHAIAHTTPIGISGDSVLLRLKAFNLAALARYAPDIFPIDAESASDLATAIRWAHVIDERFSDDRNDLAVRDVVYLPGSGVFAEAVLGRSNAAEYIDPHRYWNWQDSPIPHQAPTIQPVSTEPRTEAPLPVEPTVPGATLPLVGAPDFPDPVGLSAVLQAVQNGSIFRDMSKSDQLAGVLGGLANLAGQTAQSAANLTGDAASQALQSATDIGKTVASMAQQLMAEAPPQAAGPPRNPTTAAAASEAVDRSQGKPDPVQDATADAWGVPSGATPPVTSAGAPGSDGAPAPPLDQWRPDIDPAQLAGPGQVSNAPSVPTSAQERATEELTDLLDTAAADTGAMPDPSVLIPPLEEWYRDGVVPLLVFARHNPEYLTSAIGQYLDWLATAQQLGLDAEAVAMENLHGSARTLMVVGLENAIRDAFGQMEANNDLGYAGDVLNWIATAGQLGLEDESDLFNANQVVDESPIHVELSGPLVPGDAGLGGPLELRASGGLAIGANPPLAGKVVEVAVSVTNGTATPAAGALHPTLDFVSTIEPDGSGDLTVAATGTGRLLQGLWEFTTTRSVTVSG